MVSQSNASALNDVIEYIDLCMLCMAISQGNPEKKGKRNISKAQLSAKN